MEPTRLMLTLLGLILGLWIMTRFVRFIPNNRIGVVEKRLGPHLRQGLIALNGEAGFQPKVLRGGIHLVIPLNHVVHIAELVTIPQGKMGYAFARDGVPLQPSQALGSNSKANDFQDVDHFLRNDGQRGPQRLVLRAGTYAVNLAQFVVITEEKVYFLPLSPVDEGIIQNMAAEIAARDGFHPIVIKDSDDMIGIVTVHDGPSLPPGELIAPIVGSDIHDPERYHNNFQDADRFLWAGGMRGRQLQVLAEGTYFINRLFATVEKIPKTVVEVGQVGVVVSYTGEASSDLSGEDYKHGELVVKGCRGVWSTPLLPGKYGFNTYAGKVHLVPTTNIILKWNRTEVGAHRFDENLSEISLITKDAFEPHLPLSVVVHIDYRKAPLVIQRFGDIKRLVEQTLDPMVSAYFKNVGQTRTLIQLLQDRNVIQQIAGQEMKEKFARYNLELEEVLIGTPGSSPGDNKIEHILTQLRSRQIAQEQIETYAQQEKASQKERELREAEARARQQQALTESELSITVHANQGKAEYQNSLQKAAQIRALAEADAAKVRIMAEGEADKVRTMAEAEADKMHRMAEAEADKVHRMGEAEADRMRRMGEAEADKSARIGVAQAIAIEEQVRSYGGPQFQVIQQTMSRFAEAVQQSRVDVVPKIVFGGGQGQSGSPNLIEGLLSLLLSDQMSRQLKSIETPSPRPPEIEALRETLRNQVTM
ncbi:MAG: flotillin family protein [Armatimonadetes bacterium]|nr:flotillin family protein [Armatimonadota bacterium]